MAFPILIQRNFAEFKWLLGCLTAPESQQNIKTDFIYSVMSRFARVVICSDIKNKK
jgi:hypothetical protein